MYHESWTVAHTANQWRHTPRQAGGRCSERLADVMAAFVKVWRHSKNTAAYYMENNPAKFAPDSIWNFMALSFFGRAPLQQEKEEQQQRDE